MTLPLQKRLDVEINERLDPLEERFSNGDDISVEEIFASRAIPRLLGKQSIFLPGSTEARLRMSIPFYETVFVEICSACECVRNPKPMLPLLQTEGVVPVLVGQYSHFNPAFVKEIVKLPHISYREFLLYRSANILAQSESQVCEHCITEMREDIRRRLVPDETSERLIHQFFWLLSPFVEPDYELIGQFGAALDSGDSHRLTQIMQLAWTINAVRSSQAFQAAQTVPLGEIRRIPKISSVDGNFAVSSPDELRQIAPDELGLLIPNEISSEQYLDIVLPHRPQLTKIVAEIVEGPGTDSTTKLIAAISNINDEIRRFEHKKRFLAYRAIAGFAAGNSSIIGALLVAGALGIGGHFAGCGATVIAGVGVKALSKVKRFKSNKYIRDLGRSIHASIQPALAKVLARYLGATTRAVEVWQLRQELVDRNPKHSQRPRKQKPQRRSVTLRVRRRK